MQWLTLVPEDSGVQRLKADNKLPATTRDVDQVAPFPRVHSAHIGDGQKSRLAMPTKERRSTERRQGDRRKKQVPVLLDTRSKHDRRGFENRRKTDNDQAAATPIHRRLNLYV